MTIQTKANLVIDYSLAKAKPGDVFEVQKEGKEAVKYLIVSPDKHGARSFYAARMPLGKHKGISSIIHIDPSHPMGKHFKKLEEGKVTPVKYKQYTWYLTGNKDVDSEMAQLDQRWRLFQDHADTELKKIFDLQQDHNHHSENNVMVNDFAKWVHDGKNPTEFMPKKKRQKLLESFRNEAFASFKEAIASKYAIKAEDEPVVEPEAAGDEVVAPLSDEVEDAAAEGHHNAKHLFPDEAIDSFMHYVLKFRPEMFAKRISEYMEKYGLDEKAKKLFDTKMNMITKLLLKEADKAKED